MSETKKSSSESVPGNVYDKYGTRNPISRALMRGFDRRMMELLKHVGQPDSILEVGCGEGELIKKLANIFPSARLLGLDVSRDVIDEAKRRHVGLDFKVMSIYQLTEQFEKFDLVVASEVLEHLEDPQGSASTPFRFLLLLQHNGVCSTICKIFPNRQSAKGLRQK